MSHALPHAVSPHPRRSDSAHDIAASIARWEDDGGRVSVGSRHVLPTPSTERLSVLDDRGQGPLGTSEHDSNNIAYNEELNSFVWIKSLS